MARGTAVGEPVVSQARTPEFDAGYDRAFGPDRKPVRGRWVMVDGQLVSAEDYRPPDRALDAPILMDRFYENTKATDGADIGSRRKHRQYMKDRGLAPTSDFSDSWYAKVRADQKREAAKSRRETIARKLYEMDKP